jgi:hypothetical protein
MTSLILAAGLTVSAYGASAQTLNEETDFGLPQFYGRGKNVSVMERERPDYQALGIHAGGFTILPTLKIGLDYTNNLYALPEPTAANPSPFASPRGDVGFIVSPTIVAQSNWSRHSLTALVSYQDESFADHTTEDQRSWTIQSGGRIDVHGDSYINLGFDVEHAFETRGSATTQAQTLTPVPYDTEGAYIRGVYSQDRIQAQINADFRNFSFTNVEQVVDGVNGPTETPLAETLQNTTEGRISGRVDFALTPDEAVFTKVTYSDGDYLNGAATFDLAHADILTEVAPKRNYQQVEVLGGANFDITALARGEIGLGYVDRTYELPVYHGVSGLSASVKIEYFPTQLVTVTLTGQRLVQDAAFSQASGYFENVATLGADYELRRNIIISALAGVELDDFEGITRNDTAADFKLSGKYLVNRYVGFGSTLEYINRASSGEIIYRGPIYNETRLTVSLVLQR